MLALPLALAATTLPAAASDPPPFHYRSVRLSPELRHRMTGVSWHHGCPVPLRRLRHVRVSYWDLHGQRRTGDLVINRSTVTPLRRVFATLYAERFPIRRMHLVDRYGGSDFRSIEADNTSAFNCRPATGSTRWSEHAYGRAIDINPIENPYVYANGTTSHRASRPYLDRGRHRPGMAVRGGVLVRAFRDAGWGWGGTWAPPIDYQHFSAGGR